MSSPLSDPRRSIDLSDDSILDDSDALGPDFLPSFAHIYSEANEFETILKSTDSLGIEDDGQDGFANFVGNDLSPDEQVLARRLVKAAKASSQSPLPWLDDEISEEPVEISSSEDDQVHELPDLPADEFQRYYNGQAVDSSKWKVEPAEVIKLIIEEFGPIACPEDEEIMLSEIDGALFQDVIIVGVIHLTTHRLTFHASLLSTRPDLLPSEQILKSGSAHIRTTYTPMKSCAPTIAKRKVWVELSHDMLTIFASSSAEDRIRPLSAVLLSRVKKVFTVDPEHPRAVRFVFTNGHEAVAAFDTTESARDWRKEFTGALFLYRHRRNELLGHTAANEDNGIRISLPLHRIARIHSWSSYGHRLASIHIEPSPSQTNASFEPEVLHLGPVDLVPEWTNLSERIALAKQRNLRKAMIDSTVFVDFGPLSFTEVGSSDPQAADQKERDIRLKLALQAEAELWTARARIYHTVASFGYLVVSSHYVSFWSKRCAFRDLSYRIPATNISGAKVMKIHFLPVYGMTLQIKGQEDLKFQFYSVSLRDEAIQRINSLVKLFSDKISTPSLSLNSIQSPEFHSQNSSSSSSVSSLPPPPRVRSPTSILAPAKRAASVAISLALPRSVTSMFPKVINLPSTIILNSASLHFVCLTIGSRGDVQPYIALGLGLKKEGHRVTIVTHDEFKPWIEGFGLEHRQAGGDPAALMKLSVENKMFSPEFFKKSLGNFRPWLDQLLIDAWEACQDADVLLESPSAMAGVHIAEALGIPYFRTFTMPWTKTTQFPHAFLSPPVESPGFNAASYILFSNVMWAATSGQVNRWRRKTLGIANTNMGHLAESKIVFIYNFSQAVVPKPMDWGDTIIISGYWFLDNPDLGWEPPVSLLEFIVKARKDEKSLVYIGFGSITVPRPNKVTNRIIKAVLQSGVRAIISKGWSSRMSQGDNKDDVELEVPPECYIVDKVPHDWLFERIDVAMHHGGAGTTGASLRAGIPTLIKPWFGDQYFWATRVEKLGAGLRVPSLRVNDIADCLTKATSSRIMKEKAAAVGVKIRSEDGVTNAINTIFMYMSRASQDRNALD